MYVYGNSLKTYRPSFCIVNTVSYIYSHRNLYAYTTEYMQHEGVQVEDLGFEAEKQAVGGAAPRERGSLRPRASCQVGRGVWV